MFMSLLSHILSAWFAFFLPSYATFKALSHRPLSEPDLQRWATYWAVIGAFLTFEYVAQWFISWFPFYWEVKTLFLLFLSLPQTQGSTFIYNTYLEPFFRKNESELDAGIVSMQRSILAFVQTRLSTLWELVWSTVNRSSAAQIGTGTPGSAQADSNSAPLLSFQTTMGIWQTYGSSIMSSFRPAGAARENSSTASASAVNVPSAERRTHTPNQESSPELQHS